MQDVTTETGPQLTLPLEAMPAKDWRADIPTVSQLNRRIRGHIEGTFFDLWVRGEISNFRKPGSGHAYFCVKDATSQLRAVMFRNQLSKVKFEMKDGMEVLLHGSVTVYEARGEYQMVADLIEPVGVGALQLAFEQLKAKLHKEGLFDAQHKKKLPHLPKRIGLVTSSTGAAVKDILKVLSRRYPDRQVFIIPALVQGEKAPLEICKAIGWAERWNAEQPDRAIDVLIVGRGGGSLEDLFCFNDESVARAIHRCAIPIISAVGHEIDVTIADFVADVRAPTPSAAAEIVVPRKDELQRLVEHQTVRLQSRMLKQLEQMKLHVGHLSRRLVSPQQKIKKLLENFQTALNRLITAMNTRCSFARRRLESRVDLLNSLSPLQVITRGYSLTRKEDGSIVRSIELVKKGQTLRTRVTDGILVSEVTETEKLPDSPAPL